MYIFVSLTRQFSVFMCPLIYIYPYFLVFHDLITSDGSAFPPQLSSTTSFPVAQGGSFDRVLVYLTISIFANTIRVCPLTRFLKLLHPALAGKFWRTSPRRSSRHPNSQLAFR